MIFMMIPPPINCWGTGLWKWSEKVAKPGKVDLSSLPLRSAIVREAVSATDGHKFVGSYRYDGVSLFDILKDFKVRKKNRKEFGSVIDLLVVVENNNGDRVVLSWGEIFYPNVKHRNMVATQVSRIVPSLTKEQWPLPKMVRMVCANDLISDRNISEPSRITVLSASLSFPVQKGLGKMFADGIDIYNDRKFFQKNKNPGWSGCREGISGGVLRPGEGISRYSVFQRQIAHEHVIENFSVTPERIRKGYFVVSALDGYRVVIGYSELMNRNDQCDFLIIDMGEENKGRFRLFPAAIFSRTGRCTPSTVSIL